MGPLAGIGFVLRRLGRESLVIVLDLVRVVDEKAVKVASAYDIATGRDR